MKIATKLSDKIESESCESKPRMHLGASEIGTECDLEAWLSFRWVTYSKITPRQKRLLARGDKEEFIFEDILREAGCTVFTKDVTTGEQFRILDYDGHFGGSLDGIVLGVEDIPNEWMLAEFKTSAEKYFRPLYGYDGKTKRYDRTKGKGVRVIQPKHYAQMQIYMHYKGLKKTLYCAVNKNDDKHYFEIVDYNPNIIPKLQERARQAIFSPTRPKRITNRPGDFRCILCKHQGVCQLGDTPEINCRTCVNVVMLDEGQWQCGLTKEPKDKKGLLNACDKYQLNRAITETK